MASKDHYNLLSGGRKFGPYSRDQLREMLNDGEVKAEAICLKVGDNKLQRLYELGLLADEEREASFNEPISVEEDVVALQSAESLPVPSHDASSENVNGNDGGMDVDSSAAEFGPEGEYDEGCDYDEYEEEEYEEEDEEGYGDDADDYIGPLDSDPSYPGDEVILEKHPSVLSYTLCLCCGAFFLFLATVSVGVRTVSSGYARPLSGVAGVTLFASALFIVWILFIRRFDRFIITRTRVEVVTGMIAKNSREVRIEDIRRIDVEKPGVLGLLGVGTVLFSSAGTGGFDVAFRNITGAHAVKVIVRRIDDQPNAPKASLLRGLRRWPWVS